MKIVGLQKLKDQIDNIMERRDVYKRSSVKVPNFIINLKVKNGQSYIANYITTVLYENKLQNFRGIDRLLEYQLDGSLKQIQMIFSDIKSNAVYTNEFEGVIAFDITKLSEYANEFQVNYFLERIAYISQNAMIILFYDESLGKSMKLIKDRVIKTLGSCIDVFVEPYTLMDYTQIIMDKIGENGIEIEDENNFQMFLSNIVIEHNIQNVKQAFTLFNDLISYVDYNYITPKIGLIQINEYFLSFKDASMEGKYEK